MNSKTRNAVALMLAMLNFIGIATLVTINMRAVPAEITRPHAAPFVVGGRSP